MLHPALLLVLCTLLLAPLGLRAEDSAVITLADQPLRLIRAASVYKASAGVAVQAGDLLETTEAAAQIEIAQGPIVALAADTRIYWQSSGSPAQLYVLKGWVKIVQRGAGQALVTAPWVQLAMGEGAAIVHNTADTTELFAESGAQTIAPLFELGRVGEEKKFPLEHYALWQPDQDLKIQPRPPKQFINDMPKYFRDPLEPAPNRVKGVKNTALFERDVSYVDIRDWLTSNFTLRKTWAKRFKPRLKDKEFRAALDAELGQTPEWKPILHPPPPKPKIIKPHP
ncbi:MAG: hypothetical protein U1F46_10810 [Marinagarivorans sp.]